jgi:hypothetical protein
MRRVIRPSKQIVRSLRVERLIHWGCHLLRLSLGGITLLELELVYLGGFQFQLCDSILVEVAKVFDLVNDDLVKLLQMVRGKKRYGLVNTRCRCQRNFLLHIRRAYLELDRELGLFARLERA